MENYQTMFKKIKEEHINIRQNIKLAGESISDREALNDLARTRDEWTRVKPEMLYEKSKRLKKTLATLEEGLRNHFAFEAQYLPPFVGKWLMLALLLEHREIELLLKESKSKVVDVNLEKLSREELLTEETNIQQKVNNIGRAVEEHSHREEMLLTMVEKGLRESREKTEATRE